MGKNDKNTRVLNLSEPLKVGDKEVTELAMRRAKVRDRLEAQRMAGPEALGGEIEVHMFALLCDIPFDDLLEMPDGDYDRLQEVYVFLKGNRRPAASQAAE